MKENIANRYHHYIKFNCETKAEWDARVATVQAELAHEKSRKLVKMAAEYIRSVTVPSTRQRH